MSFFLILVAFVQSTTGVSVQTISSGTAIPSTSLTIPGLSKLDSPLCTDPKHSRTLYEIVWHCAATILACTWVAYHPDVPNPEDSRWKKLRRNVRFTLIALLIPEYMTRMALKQRIAAAREREKYNTDHPESTDGLIRTTVKWIFGPGTRWKGHELRGGYVKERKYGETGGEKLESSGHNEKSYVRWTLTHGFLLTMGGLIAYTPESDSQTVITDARQLTSTPFDVPEEFINDRSKRDNLAKFIAILQTTWFIIQCVARWVSHLPVTALEVVTFAYAFLTVSTYTLWWSKPQNIGIPFYLPVPTLPPDPEPGADSHAQTRHGIFFLFCIVAPFGAIHLIPIWLGTFPSSREKYLWEIVSIWLTIYLPAGALIGHCLLRLYIDDRSLQLHLLPSSLTLLPCTYDTRIPLHIDRIGHAFSRVILREYHYHHLSTKAFKGGEHTLPAMATLVRNPLYRHASSSAFTSFRLHVQPRNFASDHPRPVSSSTTEPVVETFSGPSRLRGKPFVRRYATSKSDPRVETYSEPSRPQPYYAKHPPFRDLPKQKRAWPYIVVAAVVGVVGWTAFMTYVTNQEMISSSVVRQIMRSIREDPKLQEALGDAIRPQPEWWLNGDPKINGRDTSPRVERTIDIYRSQAKTPFLKVLAKFQTKPSFEFLDAYTRLRLSASVAGAAALASRFPPPSVPEFFATRRRIIRGSRSRQESPRLLGFRLSPSISISRFTG
ncbi:hypothetical protein NP233_g554 [Leucocoprinus birnbaumii]|uniref:Uncharacterized protein n=1 Tax=Leucocoprinus birnbaumii TaxID=56174 RepID=A0AAD5W2M6_9AGAR|nr:hypothetical protein NP233_g554 [Leucocoprinus birnbaumii]